MLLLALYKASEPDQHTDVNARVQGFALTQLSVPAHQPGPLAQKHTSQASVMWQWLQNELHQPNYLIATHVSANICVILC